MAEPIFSEDVRPVTELKVKGSEIVEQVSRTHRPVVITRRGRAVAVLVELGEYEKMREELAFSRAVDEGVAQAKRRDFASSQEVTAVFGKRTRSR